MRIYSTIKDALLAPESLIDGRSGLEKATEGSGVMHSKRVQRWGCIFPLVFNMDNKHGIPDILKITRLV